MNGLSDFAAARSQELISFRRDLHAHPELSSQETRTTAAIVRRLQVAGLEPGKARPDKPLPERHARQGEAQDRGRRLHLGAVVAA